MKEEKLSVYILTFNNERTIEGCLESLRWADELVIVETVRHFFEERR